MHEELIDDMLRRAKNGALKDHRPRTDSALRSILNTPMSIPGLDGNGKKSVQRRGVSCFFHGFPLQFYLYETLKSDNLLHQFILNPSEKYLVLTLGTYDIGKVLIPEYGNDILFANCVVCIIGANLADGAVKSLDLISVYPDYRPDYEPL